VRPSNSHAAPMTPPWKACPDIPHGSIGWRMGCGEEVYDTFYRSFSALGDEEAAAFEQAHPEPPEWAGFYAMIRREPWR
jgi:hypothetical protein